MCIRDSPITGRDARFIVHPLPLWEDPADDERMMALGRGVREDLRAHATGGAYLNFLGDEGHRLRSVFGSNYERLARVKAEWDPDNVFRGNLNLRPAMTTA